MKIKEAYCETYHHPYRILEESGGNLAHTYFTEQCFCGNSGIVAACLSDLGKNNCSYRHFDFAAGQENELVREGMWPDFTVRGSRLYHFNGNQLLVTDTAGGGTRLIWEAPAPLIGPVSVTADESYAAVLYAVGGGRYSIGRLHLKSCIHEEFLQKSFPPPFDTISHCMINPVKAEQIFFCHEGTTQYITNRLWLYDLKNQRAENIVRQHLNKDGDNGETCGHEHWSSDGRGIYFIKYISTTIPPKGVWYVDVETRETKCIASGYDYWHVGVSPDGRFVAADTQVAGDYSDVILIDLSNGREIPLVQVKTCWRHPSHPHPMFSPDGSKVCFTELLEDGRTGIGIVDINVYR